MKRFYPLILLLLLAGFTAACGGGGGSTAGTGDPARTVERYLEAKVAGDAETIRALLCSEMESVLERETRTFDSVSGVRLDGMACADEGGGVVRCQGRILATYGTEETEFPLVAYRVTQEDGEYKWCGEAP